MTGRWWTLIDVVMMLSFAGSFIAMFVPGWYEVRLSLSPGFELVTLVWCIMRIRRDQAKDNYPYPTASRWLSETAAGAATPHSPPPDTRRATR